MRSLWTRSFLGQKFGIDVGSVQAVPIVQNGAVDLPAHGAMLVGSQRIMLVGSQRIGNPQLVVTIPADTDPFPGFRNPYDRPPANTRNDHQSWIVHSSLHLKLPT